jgi:hypothetical protein
LRYKKCLEFEKCSAIKFARILNLLEFEIKKKPKKKRKKNERKKLNQNIKENVLKLEEPKHMLMCRGPTWSPTRARIDSCWMMYRNFL